MRPLQDHTITFRTDELACILSMCMVTVEMRPSELTGSDAIFDKNLVTVTDKVMKALGINLDIKN